MNSRELPDRRRGGDRRSSKRYSVQIDLEWENDAGRHRGTISDISENGCFILSGVEVESGEQVKLFLPIGDGMEVQFYGEIANHTFEIGFAVRFVGLTEAQLQILRGFLAGEENRSSL